MKSEVEFVKSMYAKTEPIAAKTKEVMDQVAMVSWANGRRSAGYVSVFAADTDSDLFTGKTDNTKVPRRIVKAGGYK